MSEFDEFSDLKAALREATPAADPEKKQANLRLAQENFDRLQGTTAASRHSSESPAPGLIGGVKAMFDAITTKGGLTATTALVAVTLLVATPQGRDLLTPDAGPLLGETTAPADPTTLPAERIETAPATQAELPLAQPTVDPGTATTQSRASADDMGVELDAATVQDAQRSEPRDLSALTENEAADGTFRQQGTAVEMSNDAFAGTQPQGAPAPAIESLGPIMDEATAQRLPDTEAFPQADANPLKIVSEDPVSTFSIDVDTASYSIVRSSIMAGRLPPVDAVRIEEMINYFPYDYPAPDPAEAPFQTSYSVFETPWNPNTQLLHIGLQGTLPAISDRPPLNLVFLIDSSGSMNDPSKLPLLRQSLSLMLAELTEADEVAIVAYAGSAGQVLAPTPASEAETIESAMMRLRAGGSTAGQQGLQQAYSVARSMVEDGEVTRVILATDGDFNVGISNPDALEDYIAKERESGVYLSVLGFGRGNLDDAVMQSLAQNGNGTASYIDTLQEAQKVLVDQLSGALFPIADDVKIQVEFNPAQIAEYRLIGYETRALNREDFNNDAVDAGEIGAGHSVTAIYEITPVGSPAVLSAPLRYGEEMATGDSNELAFLRLRYKAPGVSDSVLIETPIVEGNAADDAANSEAQFAAAIAGFGQLLKGGNYLGDWSWDEAIELAAANRGADIFGYRGEALRLMRLAASLDR